MTKVKANEGDLKIEFLNPHRSRKPFKWPSVGGKCFILTSIILYVITAAATIAGQMYQISGTDLKQT